VPGPLFLSRGYVCPSKGERGLLAAALLGGIIVGAGTGAALVAGRVTHLALLGAGTHSGGRA
jgi:hypothetical protein